METLFPVLNGAVAIGIIVCHIMVIVKMFQNGKAGLGIATILTTFCCIGGLISFIYGWIKSTEWNMKSLMMIYTVLLILSFVLGIVSPRPPIDWSQFQQPQPVQPAP